MKATVKLAAAVSMLSACIIANAQTLPTTPTNTFAYGKDPLQQADIYLPTTFLQKGLIVWIHGGGWGGVTKKANMIS